MTTDHLRKALQHFRQVLSPPSGSALTDGQLLARFAADRDESAFAALLRRHGPMVFNVCRRVLRHTQDAEDALQASFLILARRAGAVCHCRSVGGWLHRVAYHTALRAKALNDKRKAREKQLEDLPQLSDSGIRTPDWLPLLDRELSLLPEKYREPLVLCHLQGRARKEVARQLGLPEGTLSSRLATARKMLALRLTRRGLALSGGAIAAGMAEGVVDAVPVPLASATVKVAVLVAAGDIAAVSTSVGILMKGACQTMLLAKLKLVVGAVMVVMALGASGMVYRAVGQSAPPERRPLTEVEALRRENELLKLNLEVVLEKVRAQEAELRASRSATANVKLERGDKVEVGDLLKVIRLRGGVQDVIKLRNDSKAPEVELSLPENDAPRRVTAKLHLDVKSKSDPLHEAESALKTLREARDTEAQRKAADALDKALQKLREQQKKQQGPAK